MKAIDLHSACIERISSRKDKSISFGVSTPELTSDQAAAFLQLHGINVRLLIQPQDVAAEDLVEITTDAEQKTPSRRLRAVVFVHWKQEVEQHQNPQTFNEFYHSQMEKIIEGYKTKNLENDN